MKIAMAQMTSATDKQENLQQIHTYVRKAHAQGARMVIFPEATMQAFASGRLDLQAEEISGPFVESLKLWAHQYDVAIVAGIFTPADTVGDIQRVFNTLVFVHPHQQVDIYHKIHVYDAYGFQESETVKPGGDMKVVDFDGIRFGLSICYDVRFPTLYQDLARSGAEVILIPMSWAGGEGKRAQRDTLIGARALDSTSFIVAVDQAPPKDAKDSQPLGVGFSQAISPEGRVLVTLGPDSQLGLVDIDPAMVAEARRRLPIL
ncbi:carbon-nitrogen hydrolase family protein [Corynebacterium sp. ES2794-CONJ1]|uniref:carbon-nitrogen hydrolase family protein n=1 Tax=Corynebacterium sp. ES2794-CONJ1 TaxID=2980553 RepID=UPI0021D9A0DB|nr:carbon-nitrogen hydrolase family protein [Corynebacterium sp. ES2794-CONJ1]MCU9519512.1 carbon-nitrogen hydrolase family protein [Corynebacterium sp. ES2794-CONJ1]